AHGLLVLSAATGLRSHITRMEGALLAFLEIRSWRFRKPVLIGDTIRARTEVKELRPTSNPQRGIVAVHGRFGGRPGGPDPRNPGRPV
ncbi:MAG TPA: MaoC/PaaZ C-terminal domain-containing protein, partial [Limnochordales bacterium]